MRRLLRVVLAVAVLALPLAAAVPSLEAWASVGYDSPYSYEQTFGTALRLVRIDLGAKVTEKDADGGFLLFDYTSPESGKRVHHGSIEIVRGKEGAHVAVQLPTLPSYHEQMIVDALVKKLAAEHGAPPARQRPPPPAGDGGTAEEDAGAT